MVDHANVAHISSLSRSSPYLLISLFLLTWNIVFTLAGVNLNTENPLADETVTKKLTAYIISLTSFPAVCIVVLSAKCLCVCTTQRSHHWCRKSVVMAVHDLVFVVMGTLYLAGDNLPILYCSGMSNTVDKEDCIERSAIILGFSLLLHTALYIAGPFKLNPAISTLPVTGRIRKAYQSILQLAALAILLDQTFTTVVKFITIVDIEMDESPACGCPGNTTNSASEREVAWFLTGLSSIILLIVIGIVVKGWKDYCSCCWKKRKSERRQYRRQIVENILIFFMYIVVVLFMVMYTLADSRWLYKCTPVCNGNPTVVRFGLLGTSLSLSFIWILLYGVIICCPGVCIICKRKRAFAENDYVSVVAKRENCKWVCTDARKRKVNGNGSTTNNTEIGNTMSIEDDYGSVSITLPIEEDTCYASLQDTCCASLLETEWECCNCLKNFLTWLCCVNRDTTCASNLKDTWDCCRDCIKAIWLYCCCCCCIRCCWDACKSCWDACKSCWGKFMSWLDKCKYCKEWKELMNTEDEAEIVFIFMGKNNNFTSNTLSQNWTLDMSDDQLGEHPAGTDFYVILKPNIDTSPGSARNENTTPGAQGLARNENTTSGAQGLACNENTTSGAQDPTRNENTTSGAQGPAPNLEVQRAERQPLLRKDSLHSSSNSPMTTKV